MEGWRDLGIFLYLPCPPNFILLCFIFTCIANFYLVLHESVSILRVVVMGMPVDSLLFPITAELQHLY